MMLEGATTGTSGAAASKFRLMIACILGMPRGLRHDGGSQFEIHLACVSS